MTHGEFALASMVYCFLTGASETSGCRSTVHNEAVGGVKYSAHRFGLAKDVTYDAELPEPERRETAERLGLKLIIEGTHDHLQPADWRAG